MPALARAGRWLFVEVVGWALVVLGVAALVLPGPGLLMLAGGLAVLSQRYEWAARWVAPVRRRAIDGAESSVASWPRILLTCLGIAALAAAGLLWLVGPDEPGWWPLADRWWLPGGWGTGASILVSAVAAAGLLGWSLRRFRGAPAEVGPRG